MPIEENKQLFESGEANEWFRRNKEAIEQRGDDAAIEKLAEWLEPFSNDIADVLEIGCGTGHALNKLVCSLSASGCGVDPSSEAVEYAKQKFPSLDVRLGFGDDVPFFTKFELVHLGFFLYLVDRDLYLKCISEADRLVVPGGFLSIIDFDPPQSYSNTYAHKRGVLSHKHDNSRVFVATGLYSVVNKMQFSHRRFFFDEDIDERVSLTLLYKETEIFGSQKV